MNLMKISGTVIAVIIGLFACFVLMPMFFPCCPRSRMSPEVRDCISNIKELSTSLYLYEVDYGHFPESGKWLTAVKPYCPRISGGEPADSLKCSMDSSSSDCSYEMNPALSGVSLSSIPEAKRHRIFMVREKKFPGSHGYVVFVNRGLKKR